jgi:uncharacterized protein (DUF111 family)
MVFSYHVQACIFYPWQGRDVVLPEVFLYDDGGGIAMGFNHREEHTDERMMIIQANIDDMNPELTSYISDCLFEKGANDVYWIPIIMKKGRPGIMLNVLVSDEKLSDMEHIIFKETTTIGLRYIRTACHRLGRKFLDVATEWGTVSVKVGIHNGEVVHYAPEFKHCEEIAKRAGVPLKQVYDEVRKRFDSSQLE